MNLKKMRSDIYMKKIVFLGDSTTDADRDKEARVGKEEQLGHGFVKLINAQLISQQLSESYVLINVGNSGDNIFNISDRLESDVIIHKSDYVFILVGINDVLQRYEYVVREDFVSFENYIDYYENLIMRLKKENITPIIISPFFLELDKKNPIRKDLDSYNLALKSIAEGNNVLYVDIQKEFDRFLEKNSSYIVSKDRIHLNYIGNQIIANNLYSIIIELD